MPDITAPEVTMINYNSLSGSYDMESITLTTESSTTLIFEGLTIVKPHDKPL